MPITVDNIMRHELIGLEVDIVDSTDKTLEDVSGKVVDESYNMLKIETDDMRELSLPKKNSIFIFSLPNGDKVKVNGDVLVSRPEDRIKKKFKKW